ncbi:MAG: MucBP domain-containing protein [Lacrimispora saccharolytica]
MDNGIEKAFDFESMPVRKDLDIYAKWSSNVLVEYTINYQLENGTVIADPTTGSALAGTTRTFEAKTGDQLYADYQTGYFPIVSSHSLIMNIAGGESNIYTFVYREAQIVPYTVKYLDAETNEPIADDKVVSDNTICSCY